MNFDPTQQTIPTHLLRPLPGRSPSSQVSQASLSQFAGNVGGLLTASRKQAEEYITRIGEYVYALELGIDDASKDNDSRRKRIDSLGKEIFSSRIEASALNEKVKELEESHELTNSNLQELTEIQRNFIERFEKIEEMFNQLLHLIDLSEKETDNLDTEIKWIKTEFSGFLKFQQEQMKRFDTLESQLEGVREELENKFSDCLNQFSIKNEEMSLLNQDLAQSYENFDFIAKTLGNREIDDSYKLFLFPDIKRIAGAVSGTIFSAELIFNLFNSKIHVSKAAKTVFLLSFTTYAIASLIEYISFSKGEKLKGLAEVERKKFMEENPRATLEQWIMHMKRNILHK